MKEMVAAGAVIAGIVLFVAWVGGPAEDTRPSAAAAPRQTTSSAVGTLRPATTEDAAAIAAQQEARVAARFPALNQDARTALQALRGQLSDPDSARFRNVWAMRYPVQGQADAAIFCGEVNARNRFGGYVGFEPFMALGHTVYTAETSDVFEGMYRDFCLGAPPIAQIDADAL